jgi:glycolate oxidase
VTKLNKTITRFTQIVGEDNIRTAPEVTAQHAVDGVSPGVVVFPGDMEQVAEVVRLANKERLTIFPWGSGSKTSGATPPKQLDLVACMSRLNTIIDMDTANLTVTVQAGVKFKDVQMGLSSRENRCYLPITKDAQDGGKLFCSERNRTGCFLPLDPPFFDTATMGGIIAGNSTGPRRLLYGLPRDLVLGVRFVAPNGEIIGAGGKTVKNVSGYDISKLMIGSYGSLGILCEMTLRLLPLPERMETRLFSFSSFTHASDFVTRIFESNLLPAAVELMNSHEVEQLPYEGLSGFESGGYEVAVALEDFQESVERMKSEMTEMVSDLAHKGETGLEEKEHGAFWAAVSNTDRSLFKRFNGLITAKLSYPLSEWKGLIPIAEEALSGLGTGHVLQAHAGSGVCRISLLTDNPNKETLEKAIQALGKISEHCSRIGGTLFITRGPASLRKHFSVWAKPGPELLVMKRIKEHLDPSGVMCPAPFMGDL